jgi:hypothetical protein
MAQPTQCDVNSLTEVKMNVWQTWCDNWNVEFPLVVPGPYSRLGLPDCSRERVFSRGQVDAKQIEVSDLQEESEDEFKCWRHAVFTEFV